MFAIKAKVEELGSAEEIGVAVERSDFTARNEEQRIGDCLDSLSRQTYPAELLAETLASCLAQRNRLGQARDPRQRAHGGCRLEEHTDQRNPTTSEPMIVRG